MKTAWIKYWHLICTLIILGVNFLFFYISYFKGLFSGDICVFIGFLLLISSMISIPLMFAAAADSSTYRRYYNG